MSAKSSSLNTRPKSQCHRSLRLNKKSNNGMLFSARNSRIPTPSWSNGSDKIKSETFVDDKVSQLQRRPHDLPTDAVFQVESFIQESNNNMRCLQINFTICVSICHFYHQ